MKTFKTPKGTELPLLNLKGKDYLQVAHRIQWFREEHPMGLLESECVESNENYVIYKASVFYWVNDRHVKVADSVKREDYSHFPDAHEKANTGAVGRALALCGYGTQFAQELDEGERIVDSPRDSKPKSGPGSYIVKMGQKFKGHRLDDCDIYELASFSKWLSQQPELNGIGLETRDAIEAYLKTREPKGASK